MTQAELKARLLKRKATRETYRCHGARAYFMPGTGWNKASDHGARWVETLKGAGLRFVGYCDDIRKSIRHKGWYCDQQFQEEVFRGVVLQLPARHGKPRLFAAYEDPFNDGAYCVDTTYIFTDREDAAEDAALAADRFAEICAQRESDYQAEERARLEREEQQAAEYAEEVEDAVSEY